MSTFPMEPIYGWMENLSLVVCASQAFDMR
jgi:hypothetical protein